MSWPTCRSARRRCPTSTRDPTRTNAVERWCNEVAAEFLVPMARVPRAVRPGGRPALATPAARRALPGEHPGHPRSGPRSRRLDVGQVPRRSWSGRARVAALMAERGSGGQLLQHQAGADRQAVRSALVASALEGQTSYTEAFRLLGLKRPPRSTGWRSDSECCDGVFAGRQRDDRRKEQPLRVRLLPGVTCVSRGVKALFARRLRAAGVGQGGAPAAKRGRTTLTNPRAGADSLWAG